MRGPARQPRVPVAPLITALVRRGVINSDGHTVYEVARAVGLSPPVTTRALRSGELTVWAADRAAVNALNVHPTDIWGDDWLDPDDLNDPTIDRAVRIDHAINQLRKATAA